MKKLLSLVLILSLLAILASCGCQEEPTDNSNTENNDLLEDKDNNGYSDIFDGELPVIPLN